MSWKVRAAWRSRIEICIYRSCVGCRFQLFHQWPFHSICIPLRLSYSNLDAPHVARLVFYYIHLDSDLFFFFFHFCHTFSCSYDHLQFNNYFISFPCWKKWGKIRFVTSVLSFICCVFHFNLFRPRTGFDKSSLERLEQLFRKTVGNEREIRREDFKKIVTSKNVRIAHYLLWIWWEQPFSLQFLNKFFSFEIYLVV